jgi:hypothetical protein
MYSSERIRTDGRTDGMEDSEKKSLMITIQAWQASSSVNSIPRLGCCVTGDGCFNSRTGPVADLGLWVKPLLLAKDVKVQRSYLLLFFVYLTKLCWLRIAFTAPMIMNRELIRIWKKSPMTYFKILLRYFL